MEQSQFGSESEIQTTGDGIINSRTTGSIENTSGEEISGSESGENIRGQENLSTTTESGIQQQLADAAKSIKKPIFIATAEGNIATTIERILFEENCDPKPAATLNKDEYVLLVVNPEVYQALRQQYLFTLLSEDEQSRAQQVAVNEELHEKARAQALQIEYFIWNHDIETGKPGRSSLINSDNEIVFNESELRIILNKIKAKNRQKEVDPKNIGVSHQDTWNVMDLLLLQGFIMAENLLEEIHARQKRKYKLVIGDQDRLKHLTEQLNQSLYLQQKYKDQELSLVNQIKELQINIDNKHAEDIKDQSKSETAIPGNLDPSL